MFLLLVVVGGAGACLVYAVPPRTASGARIKNAAGIVVAVAIGAALSRTGITFAWNFPVAWCAAFLLMWAFQFGGDPEELIWLRALTSTGLVTLLAQFFR